MCTLYTNLDSFFFIFLCFLVNDKANFFHKICLYVLFLTSVVVDVFFYLVMYVR